MQAVGMVNDHLVDCFRYPEIPAESEDLIFHDKEECRGGIEKR
jgi:hypothetical protein